jgi:beta-phosphoglucomutase family hydrolase
VSRKNLLEGTMIKGVIFDMDGVIVNSEPLHDYCNKQILKKYNAKLDKKTSEKVKGLRDEDAFQFYVTHFNIDEEPQVLIEKKMQLYMRMLKKKLRMYPGFKRLAKQCKRKFKVGLATSSPKQSVSMILKHFDIKHYFDALVTAEDVRLAKPYPDPYLKAAEKLHVKANQCLVIEDTIHGITAAKTAGAKCIAVSNTFSKRKLKSTSVDHVVDSLTKLSIDKIKKI